MDELFTNIFIRIKSLRPCDDERVAINESTIDQKQVDEILRLIDSIDNVNYTPSTGGYANDSLLLVACEYGATRIIQKLLEKRADVNKANNKGETPLHYACERVFVDSDPIFIIRELIRSGAAINARTLADRETPLASAVALTVDPSIIEELLNNGADLHIPAIQEDKEVSVLELAIIGDKLSPNYKPIIRLLLDRGAITSQYLYELYKGLNRRLLYSGNSNTAKRLKPAIPGANVTSVPSAGAGAPPPEAPTPPIPSAGAGAPPPAVPVPPIPSAGVGAPLKRGPNDGKKRFVPQQVRRGGRSTRKRARKSSKRSHCSRRSRRPRFAY
jgi:ankyrin repeat protein